MLGTGHPEARKAARRCLGMRFAALSPRSQRLHLRGPVGPAGRRVLLVLVRERLRHLRRDRPGTACPVRPALSVPLSSTNEPGSPASRGQPAENPVPRTALGLLFSGHPMPGTFRRRPRICGQDRGRTVTAALPLCEDVLSNGQPSAPSAWSTPPATNPAFCQSIAAPAFTKPFQAARGLASSLTSPRRPLFFIVSKPS